MSGRAGLRRLARSSRDSVRDTHAAIVRLDGLLGGGVAGADAVTIGAAAGGRESALLEKLARHVDRGLTLSAALRRSDTGLSPADLALIEAGERSGDLAKAVAALRRRLDLRFGTRKRLVQVLVYPLALVATTMAVLAPMSVWVLPAFATMYAGAAAELPLATRVVMASGRALADHAVDGPLVLAIVAVAFAISHRRSRRVRVTVDRFMLAAPLLGRLTRAEARSELYATLGALLGAGVDIDEALILATPACENRVLRRRFERVRPSVRRGLTLSAALERCGLDRRGHDAAMLRTAEAIGDYAASLERLAAAARIERDELLDRTVRAVQPVSVAFMAIVVGATVLAVYQPVLGSASLLQGGMK
jgi:type II secretory pathway component PulF